jgi:hypothetical protein
VFYGSNLYRKDKPRWLISHSTEAPSAGGTAFRLASPVRPTGWEAVVAGLGGTGGHGGTRERFTERVRGGGGLVTSWLIGLPRRAGGRLHAMNDAEARWWRWHVAERCGGLVRQYRDARFAELREDPSIRRDGLGAELAGAEAAPPDCSCGGER